MAIELKKIKHIIEEQHTAEQDMLMECKSGNYTPDATYVKLNPYGTAPLTALIHFKTPEAMKAGIYIKGKEKAGDMSCAFPKAKEHFLPVFGLYPDHANEVKITLDNGEEKNLTIKTKKAPDKVLALAGYPKDHIEAFTQAGVDFYVYVRANVVQTVRDVMKKIGVV